MRLQQHVGGLQVRVHDAQAVHIGQALGNLLGRPQQRPLREHSILRQCTANTGKHTSSSPVSAMAT